MSSAWRQARTRLASSTRSARSAGVQRGRLTLRREDEELLAQEGVLGDEGGPAAHEVGERARHDGLVRRASSR